MATNPLLSLFGGAAKAAANSTVGKAVVKAASNKANEIKSALQNEAMRNAVLPRGLKDRAAEDQWLQDNGYLQPVPKQQEQKAQVSPTMVPNTTIGPVPDAMKQMSPQEKTIAMGKAVMNEIAQKQNEGIANTGKAVVNRLAQIPQNLNKISQIQPNRDIANPLLRTLDQTGRFLVGDQNQPGIFGAGYNAAEVVVPQLRAATFTPQMIGETSQNVLPESISPYVGRGLQAYSVLKSPFKNVAIGNIVVDETADAISRATTGKNLFDAIDSADIPTPLKGFLKSGYNIGSGFLGAKYGMKASSMAKANKQNIAELKAGVKAGYEEYKRTGDIKSAAQAADNAMLDFLQANRNKSTGSGEGEVLGWNSTKKKEPVMVEGDIQSKINALEQSLGLEPTVPGSSLEGMRGLGKLAGSIRKTKNAAESLLFGKENVGEQGIYGTTQQRVRNSVQRFMNKGMSADNIGGVLTRNVARSIAGKTGMKAEQINMRGKLKGQIALANDLTKNLADSVYKLTMKDPNALARLHAELDPALYKAKELESLKQRPLSVEDTKALTQLRLASDMLNEINYKNGFLSKATYEQGKNGKYIARAYRDFDFANNPQAKKVGVKPLDPIEFGMYENRKEMDSWKQDHAIRDPAWLMSKRVHETLVNDAVKKYYAWAATNPEYISPVPKPGYTQIEVYKKGVDKSKIIDDIIKQQYGDVSGKELKSLRAEMGKMSDVDLSTYQKRIYGDLAGKYVRQDILEDVRGFYYNNQILQAVYDGLKMYNNNPIRQGVKKLKTVFNPVVRLGNRIGGVVFANFMGVNPFSFIGAYAKSKQNSKLWRALQAEGVLGTGYVKSEIRKAAMDIANPPKPKNILSRSANKIDEFFSEGYSRVDDRGKVAVARVLLDRGYSFDYVVNQLRQGMQDYSVVGKAFDIGSKLPVFGKAFGKFGSNAVMIIKNGLLNRPLRMASTLFAIKALTDLASYQSGETQEDRKTRESRVGTSYIPFSSLLAENGIPLTVQTPLGEINFGRMFGLQSLQPEKGAGIWNDLLTFSPIDDSVNSDVLLGPALTAGGAIKAMLTGEKNSLENDFRGKSIRDPEMNKFQADTYLPKKDQLANIGSYLLRSYAPQQVNDAADIYNAYQGKEDFYGRNKTLGQAVSRAVGFKLETFGPKEAQRARDRELAYEEKQQDGQDRFDLTYTVKQAVRNGSFDNQRLDEVKTQNIKRDSYVTEKEISEAQSVDNNQGLSREEIETEIKLRKIKSNIRNTNNLILKDIIEEGRTNRGSREMLRAKFDQLVRESVATYEDPEDKLNYIKERLNDLESKW